MKVISFLCLIAVAQFAVAADDDTKAQKKLAGTWAGGVDNGAQGHVLTFKADLVTCIRKSGGRTSDIGGGKIKLDLSKKPWELTGAGTKGGQKGKTWYGIYSLEGDTLKWCVNSKKTPTEFKTGNGNFCLVLKRQKKD